ncbi:uncharacterized protein PHALS_14205 [Plasmopara halstedii]|uniref:Uncharacterized protein n=1 Tax=Plasmopara halstedii TaxID=4781 RepID=A0A0P1AQQ9_PLAHL|nr:uncharacterized protein PHALS_14205 [Plasmopara halstedii]CEG43924.1 hypothetical protein PHALS_14205 [Plasmopara halstedii]|eukprot:XP_024580293.1 hypothetical protein PHALS_14205 [Plasmopara halstedii]
MREGDDVLQSMINFRLEINSNCLEKSCFSIDMHKGQMEGASFEYEPLSLHNQGEA